ncbi:MAG: hypothetical protein E5X57_20470 [Mesorhizobium sp.]|nr:MAG: hypothetical protein E5X57_20470 [Mesorhizobium sp.]
MKTKLYPLVQKNGRNTNGLDCTADTTARANDSEHNQPQNAACRRPVARAAETNETLPRHYRKTSETKAVYDKKSRSAADSTGETQMSGTQDEQSSLGESPTRLAPKPEGSKWTSQ